MKELSEKMKQMQSTVDLKFLSEPSTLEAIRNSFAAFGSLSLKVTTPEYFEAIQRAFSVPPIDPEIFTTSARTLKALAEASKPIDTPDYEKLLSSVYAAIRASAEYMTEEQAECAEKISPEILNPEQPASTPRKRLTLSDLLALLSLLTALLFGVLQQLPDKQLEELSEQNEIIIAQNDEAACQRQQLIEQNEVFIEQNSKELELLQQLVDARQEIIEYINENRDLLADGENPLVERDHAVLETDDGIDDDAETPEAENDDDSADEQGDTDPD